MISILFYSLLCAFAVLSLAALLPVRLSLSVSGGSDPLNGNVTFDGRALFFNGWLGGGVSSIGGGMRLSVLFRTTTLMSFSIAGFTTYAGRKIRDHQKKKTEKEKKKKPAGAKKRKPVKEYLSMARTGFGVARWILREFSGVVGLDRFSAQVTLGLGRPDITGLISGFLIGLNGILPERFEIFPSWDFTREVIRGDVTLSLTLRGYILLSRLVTRVPAAVYRQRKEIVYWFKTFRSDPSRQTFQEV